MTPVPTASTAATHAATLDPERFRAAMAQFPTFVTVVTTTGPDGPVGCTVNAVLSLSTRPPSLLVSLASGSRTLTEIRAAGVFAVNALAWRQRDLCEWFAAAAPEERFRRVAYRQELGVPVLSGSAAALVCVVESAVDLFDHQVLVGRIAWADAGAAPRPLVLHRRRLHTLAR
ncbi:MAG TPA: flavin reductase family protein [Pilimelia sp.]|nr:flavin reductase family protein [Pilimelia sp.]